MPRMLPADGMGTPVHCQTDRVISHARVLGGGQKTSQKRFLRGKFLKSYIIPRRVFTHEKAVAATPTTRVTGAQAWKHPTVPQPP